MIFQTDACASSSCDQLCRRSPGPSRHTCYCRQGFRIDPGEEAACQDVDECAEGRSPPEGDPAPACQQVCANTEGSFSCSCSEGYSYRDPAGDGVGRCFAEGEEAKLIYATKRKVLFKLSKRQFRQWRRQ